MQKTTKKILVNLIDENPIQNIQFIKEYIDVVDEFIFISTNEMEYGEFNRTDAIIEALNLSDSAIQRIIVKPQSISDIEKQLSKPYDINIEYIVNISGGTKLMTITCLNYFRELNSKIFFVPKNMDYYMQIFPYTESSIFKFRKQITLREYIQSYGLVTTEITYASKSYKECKRLMQRVIDTKGNKNQIPEIKNAHSMARNIDKEFYSGGWLEEYTYHTIKEHFNLKQNQIGYKVKIENRNTNNEYDVVFVLKEKLYLIECKAYFGNYEIKKKIESALYKLAALDDDFGIQSQSVFITTFDLKGYSEVENETLLNRAKDMNVVLLQLRDLMNKSFPEIII